MALVYKNKFQEEHINRIPFFTSLRNISGNVRFTFSIYKNGTPGSGKTESRDIVKTTELSYDVIERLLDDLPQHYELAINSLVEIDNELYHLALIDFCYNKIDKYFVEKVSQLKREYSAGIHLFNSGRSFHGYQDLLLTDHQWKKYLGQLLLLNNCADEESVVDDRWIGHSLMQGYSALRISHNTLAYKQIPKFEAVI